MNNRLISLEEELNAIDLWNDKLRRDGLIADEISWRARQARRQEILHKLQRLGESQGQC